MAITDRPSTSTESHHDRRLARRMEDPEFRREFELEVAETRASTRSSIRLTRCGPSTERRSPISPARSARTRPVSGAYSRSTALTQSCGPS